MPIVLLLVYQVRSYCTGSIADIENENIDDENQYYILWLVNTSIYNTFDDKTHQKC